MATNIHDEFISEQIGEILDTAYDRPATDEEWEAIRVHSVKYPELLYTARFRAWALRNVIFKLMEKEVK